MIAYITKHKNQMTVLLGILTALGFISGLIGSESLLEIALINVTIIVSIPIFIKATQDLRMKAFCIELLVSIAVLGAVYIAEYTESVVVTFLFLLGDCLEMRTLEKNVLL